MVRLFALAASLLTADPAVIPLSLKVGEVWPVCQRSTIICPAHTPICDNPLVAVGEFDPHLGLVWRGVGPGTTLCSASAHGAPGSLRTVFRVTVR